MRIILSQYLASKPQSLQFKLEKHGKPWLPHPSKITFNLSHSQDLALLAIGQHFPLGVDLECFSPRPYQGIAERMFSPKEIQAFEKLPHTLKPMAFFNVWAQKEALIKATGLGLAYDTQTFNVPLFSPNEQPVEDKLHEKIWKMNAFMPKIGYAAAICYDLCIEKLDYFVIPKNYLHDFSQNFTT